MTRPDEEYGPRPQDDPERWASTLADRQRAQDAEIAAGRPPAWRERRRTLHCFIMQDVADKRLRDEAHR